MKTRSILRLGTAGGTALLSGWAAAQPVDFEPASLLTARYISTLEWNDNFDLRDDPLGDALFWNNTLGAALIERTRISELVFDAQGTVRFADFPVVGYESSFDDPRVLFSYALDGRNDSVELSANYRRVDVDFFDPLDAINPDGSFDQTFGGGTRESYGGDLGLVINEFGPVTFALDSLYREVDYTDTDDPDLNDRTDAFARGELRFRVNPILALVTGASYGIRNEETDRTTARADVGLNGEVNPRLDVRARLGYSRVDFDRPGDDDDETQEGAVGSLDFGFEMPNGEARAGFDVDLDENGQRVSFLVGRSLEFPSSELNANIGASTNEDTDIRAVGNITYAQELRRSQFVASLAQRATTDDEGDNVLNTNARLGYTRFLTDLSNVDLSLAGGLQRDLTDDSDNEERLNFTASYNRTLARDWGMAFGYRYRYRQSEDDVGIATSNAVFLTLRRDYQTIR